ncbi:MAG: fumarylacetoacetase [Steroidobacteraceae bacterium]
MALDSTHDPDRRSWVEAANIRNCDFPIQNLPFGVFRRAGSDTRWRGGIAIGDQILDAAALSELGILRDLAQQSAIALGNSWLNAFMEMGRPAWRALRHGVADLLSEGASARSDLVKCLLPQSKAQYAVPARIGDYTDFYTSIYHATEVGRLFRPDNPLLPNYKWVPIGYHGRSSSIAVSGQIFHRPSGQIRPSDSEQPKLAPCARLDYEVELAAFVGVGNPLGQSVRIEEAEDRIFGLCLLNDWSARDIQAWEYQPLGPFLAKNFATTISPWIVTLDALEPFRVPWTRAALDPQPLPYLDSTDLRQRGAMNITLEAAIETAKMRAARTRPHVLARSNFRHSYWSIAQLVAHHTVNGCNLRPGDMLGTGTQSGPEPEEAGSLLELSKGGKQPVDIGNGETRCFVEDGDRITLRGWCEAPGHTRIGFGECVSSVAKTPDPQAQS